MRVWIEGTNEQRIVDLIRRQEKLPKAQQDTLNLCQALSTKSWVGYVDDTLICCWGLIPPTIMANTAYLWLYTRQRSRSNGSHSCAIRSDRLK